MAMRGLVASAMVVGSVTTPLPSLAAQDLVLERYERWKLHPAPGDPEPRISAQLYLFVRNNTPELVKQWRAILVVRDTLGTEFFRLPIERDSADLGPGDVARLELRFNDQPGGDDPYDHLMAQDTANLVPTFDEVLVVQAAPVGYVAAGAPVCFTKEAMDAVGELESVPDTPEWRAGVEAEGCQWAQQMLTVEVLEAGTGYAARVRWQRLERVVWMRRADVRIEVN
jgi:hypothetical protein